MRGATECAKRLKSLFSSMRSKLGNVPPPALSDPISQLILGILSRDTPESKASEGLERLRGMVVDYNELRVIPALELSEVLRDFADARLKCEDVSRALNAIFAREHAVSLDRIAALPKRESAAALNRVEGLEPYTRARIRLLGFRQHAIPLDEAMWAYARDAGIIDGKCSLDEAQAFLERRIAESQALEFVALLKKQAWAEKGAAVRKGEVERILSKPPDRTSQNMLQAVSRMATGQQGAVADDGALADDDFLTPDLDADAALAEPATGSQSRRARTRKSSGREAAGKQARRTGCPPATQDDGSRRRAATAARQSAHKPNPKAVKSERARRKSRPRR